MTETHYFKTEYYDPHNYKPFRKDPTKYSGMIYQSDFYSAEFVGNNPCPSKGSQIAERIAKDEIFDKTCKYYYENTQREIKNAKEKGLSLEEYRKEKYKNNPWNRNRKNYVK